AAIGAPGGLLPAHPVRLEVLPGDDAAVRLHRLGEALGEVTAVEVVAALVAKPLESARHPCLPKRLTDVEQRAFRHEDLASLRVFPEQVALGEHLAVKEGVDLEAVPGEFDGGRHQVLLGPRPVALERRLEARPPSRYAGSATRAEVLLVETLELGEWRIHRAVHVGRLASRRVEVEHAQNAGDGCHVGLDYRLRDRGSERRVSGIPALLQGVYGDPADDGMRGARHPLATACHLLATEMSPLNQLTTLGGFHGFLLEPAAPVMTANHLRCPRPTP